jgi:uncharacterized protein
LRDSGKRVISMEKREVEKKSNVHSEQQEAGVEIPVDRIDPDTLRNLIIEFVTRGEEWGDTRYTLDDKIEQVLRQLKEKKAKVVFDLSSNTGNIVVSQSSHY